jgi:hypothetical protein
MPRLRNSFGELALSHQRLALLGFGSQINRLAKDDGRYESAGQQKAQLQANS